MITGRFARIFLFAGILLLIGLGSLDKVHAHEIRPALLNIVEQKPGWFEVTWKVPVLPGYEVDITPVLPASLAAYGPPAIHDVPGAKVQVSTYQAKEGGLAGEIITIDGLSATQIDTMVRISFADGTTQSAILRPAEPSFTVPAQGTRAEIAWIYLRLGVEHILQGVDHLLFVLGLLLIVGRRWKLFKTITAFTIAHSITLAAATLGYVSAPIKPIEATIALSILFLGPEIVRVWRGETSFTIRHPWVVAFAFGLLHGFGFASGLSNIGLPNTEIPTALLLFNVGVEVGQLLFVLAIVMFERFTRNILNIRWPRWATALPAYTVGSLGAFWTIQRVAVMFGGFVK
jgi:hydrogenase/urease accessory protein HupE